MDMRYAVRITVYNRNMPNIKPKAKWNPRGVLLSQADRHCVLRKIGNSEVQKI